MKAPNIIDKSFCFFSELQPRFSTNRIILHHTGGADIDAYAEQIHQWHLAAGYAGIGYHFVIRKDGTIERGRPLWAVGSHAYGANFDSLGIHLSGDFSYSAPSQAQIDSAAALIAYLADKYKIPVDRAHILGHRDVCATDCPGIQLYNLIDVLIARASWAIRGAPDTIDTPEIIFKPRAGMLSEHFSESEFEYEVDPRLIELLEKLRFNIGGYPLYILNRHERYELRKLHERGLAVDIEYPAQLSLGQLKWYVENLQFGGIGYFPTHVHLDIADGRRFYD